MGVLFDAAAAAHLPDSGKKVNEDVESICAQLAALGGFPSHLSASEQADFGLGFFHQRAMHRARRSEQTEEAKLIASIEDQPATEQADTEGEEGE
jgi:CRISPR-associated protein Csd1